MITETELFNQDGRYYGVHVHVVAESFYQALEELVERFGEDRVYGSHSIWDQFRWEWHCSRRARCRCEVVACPQCPYWSQE